MDIYYTCRHCNTCQGSIPKQHVPMEQLGLDQLTAVELQDVVIYDRLGNIHVQITCDYCEEAFKQNPLLHEIDFIIQ